MTIEGRSANSPHIETPIDGNARPIQTYQNPIVREPAVPRRRRG